MECPQCKTQYAVRVPDKITGKERVGIIESKCPTCGNITAYKASYRITGEVDE